MQDGFVTLQHNHGMQRRMDVNGNWCQIQRQFTIGSVLCV